MWIPEGRRVVGQGGGYARSYQGRWHDCDRRRGVEIPIAENQGLSARVKSVLPGPPKSAVITSPRNSSTSAGGAGNGALTRNFSIITGATTFSWCVVVRSPRTSVRGKLSRRLEPRELSALGGLFPRLLGQSFAFFALVEIYFGGGFCFSRQSTVHAIFYSTPVQSNADRLPLQVPKRFFYLSLFPVRV